jgi:hypothetical protein
LSISPKRKELNAMDILQLDDLFSGTECQMCDGKITNIPSSNFI